MIPNWIVVLREDVASWVNDLERYRYRAVKQPLFTLCNATYTQTSA